MWIIVVAVIVFFIFLYEKSTEIKKSVEDKEVERDRARIDHAHSIATAAAMATAKAAALVAANSLAEFQAIKREAAESTALSIARADAAYAAKASALAKANSVAESEAIKREAADAVARSIAEAYAAHATKTAALAKAAALATANSIAESQAAQRQTAEAVARSVAMDTVKAADLDAAISFAEFQAIQHEATEAIARASTKADAIMAATIQLTKEKNNDSNLYNESADMRIKINAIILAFESQGVHSFWHMTHRDNIKNILQDGILSNTQAFNATKPVDISDHDVQRRRDAKDPIYSRKIHDYAPTYFNIKNPMLSVRRNIQDELCLIEISLLALLEGDFIFTDGNAAARDTKFYNSLSDLANLPWNVLNSNSWINFEDGKRKRCSEMLIYPSISPKHIKKIHCYSDFTLQQVARISYSATKTRELFF